MDRDGIFPAGAKSSRMMLSSAGIYFVAHPRFREYASLALLICAILVPFEFASEINHLTGFTWLGPF
jgi:hypothetical protein